jgi:hypothetical protein
LSHFVKKRKHKLFSLRNLISSLSYILHLLYDYGVSGTVAVTEDLVAPVVVHAPNSLLALDVIVKVIGSKLVIVASV